MIFSLSPDACWQPLPPSAWNADTARHLLRRAGWTAQTTEVERAVQDGLTRTLDRLFPAKPTPLIKPSLIAKLEADGPAIQRKIAQAPAGDEKRLAQRQARERSEQAVLDLSIKWLQHAAQPANAASEKWTFFLGDVYVVSHEKVKNAALMYQHQATLRSHAFGPAPALTKAVSRSPAMIAYLDLQQNKREAPNENFARELFELFTLGEGHYTEADIKEAARAFTGYRQVLGEFRYQARQHDAGRKTVFGESGPFKGDDIVDLVYRQPAAGAFLPKEMARFYLTENPLPSELFAPLGAWWRTTGYDLRQLLHRFFASQLFFAPEFRGNYIKSPVHYYLGLIQDLSLDVAPFPRYTLTPLRQMGQQLFQPPNVRGWVGGRQWINSGTLAARRQLVGYVFAALDETLLNADEQIELVAARAEGKDHFTVAPDRFAPLLSLPADQAALQFTHAFLPASADASYPRKIARFLAAGASGPLKPERLRNAALTLLQAPEYQLC